MEQLPTHRNAKKQIGVSHFAGQPVSKCSEMLKMLGRGEKVRKF